MFEQCLKYTITATLPDGENLTVEQLAIVTIRTDEIDSIIDDPEALISEFLLHNFRKVNIEDKGHMYGQIRSFHLQFYDSKEDEKWRLLLDTFDPLELKISVMLDDT